MRRDKQATASTLDRIVDDSPNIVRCRESLDFVVEVAKTSPNLSAKQGTLASPTTEIRTIVVEPRDSCSFESLRDGEFHDVPESVC